MGLYPRSTPKPYRAFAPPIARSLIQRTYAIATETGPLLVLLALTATLLGCSSVRGEAGDTEHSRGASPAASPSTAHLPRPGSPDRTPSSTRPDTGRWFGQHDLDDAYLPPSTDADRDQGNNLPDASRHVFHQTNGERTPRGLNALQPEATLSRIACRHNKDMMAHGYMGHEDSEGRGPSHRIAREHRRGLVKASGENVLWAQKPRSEGATLAADLVTSWMNSPGHRENILKSTYTHVGTCVTRRRDTVRATQVFAKMSGYLDAPLPWAVTGGDSLRVSARVLRGPRDLDRYSFVRVGQPAKVALQDMKQYDGMLHFPEETGLFTLHFWSARREKQSIYYDGIAGGPYVRVTSP